MAGGGVGRGVVVDLSQGFHWTAPDWPRRRLWAGASVTWAGLTAAARPFGLRLPPDPSSGAFATMGGMGAPNAAGRRSVRSGSVRSWVEAIEIIGADGEARRVIRGAGSPKGVPAGPGERFHLSADQRRLIATRFPKTRKNAAGYALDRFAESGDELDLLTGSEGTLAFITAVQWRLEPIPADVAGAAPGVERLEQGAEAVPSLVALNPSAGELLDRTLLHFARAAGRLCHRDPRGGGGARHSGGDLRTRGRRPRARERAPRSDRIRVARCPGGALRGRGRAAAATGRDAERGARGWPAAGRAVGA